MPAYTTISPEIEKDLNESDIKENDIISADPDTSTRGARGNYQIYVNSPISSPEENESWTQNDWSGGPGQAEYSALDKFKSSENLKYDTPTGALILDDGENLEVWTRMYANDAPYPRMRYPMVWSPGTQRIYINGGMYRAGGNWGVSDRTYEYDPVTNDWDRIGTSGEPNGRCNHVAVWDSYNNYLWIYGGRTVNSNNILNDLWSYNPSSDSWNQWTDGPSARCYASAVFNPIRNEIIIYGGNTGDLTNPSKEVLIYDVVNHQWEKKTNYTARFDHDAVWCLKTQTMLVYGGASSYASNTYTYVNELNEYFPGTDSWVNRTPMGNRVRPILVWNSLDDILILNGGYDNNRANDTWHYDVDADTWTQKLSGPIPPRDHNDGAWDTTNNLLITYGGEDANGRRDDTWSYDPTVHGYQSFGELESSVFDPGHNVNLREVSYNTTKPLSSSVGPAPVKIKIASGDSAANADTFVGPNGLINSYFSQENGQATPNSLDGNRYMAYKVNISTQYRVYSPQLNWITIDYYTYPETYEYVSGKYPLSTKYGLALRKVDWYSIEPTNTNLEIYIRQAYSEGEIESKSWENVTKGQTMFNYKDGTFFQYKAVFTTTDRSKSAVLDTITFTFNQNPTKPTLTSPLNNTWVADSKPLLSWEFSDPDVGDYQSAFEINIAYEQTFTVVPFTFKSDSPLNSFKLTQALNDGEYYWRMRVRDNYQSLSPWSDMFILKIDTTKPAKPILECYSHPLEHIWYQNKRAAFDWNEPYDISGIGGYSYSLDRDADADPLLNVTMTVDEYNLKRTAPGFAGLVIYDNLQEGTWYFHLKAVDAIGVWSDTVTRQFRIDTLPVSVTDNTPSQVVPGGDLYFDFNLSDTGSGVDLATISWRYSSEFDYRFDELVMDDTTGTYQLYHLVESSSDPYIEYYITVSDLAEPANEINFPSSGHNRINIIDNIPPKIHEITCPNPHNRYNDLEITVGATDNVGISEVKIFFNDLSTGRSMSISGNAEYSITIDRLEVGEFADFNGGSTIYFYIQVWDYQNNTDRFPKVGNYNITISVPEEEEEEEEETKEKGGWLTDAMKINLIILIAIIVIVFIVLFIFIRKQSYKMDEDRHKLRMAIADVSEAQSAGAGAAPAAGGLDMPAELPSLYGDSATAGAGGTGATPTSQLPPIDITAVSTGAGEAPAAAPALDTQVTPAGYLPPATQPQPAPQAGTEPPQADPYAQAGLMTEPSTPQPQPTPESVQVQDGLSVSLPGEPKPVTPEVEQPTMTPTQSASEFDESLMWKPPGEQQPVKKPEDKGN
ncbi:MAG: hypothetical protein JSV49_05810 [Thermoplasmata archaeon]|nr:MAG: hypothetical protein JSV49_05810 [Thermoplasmata archaeon]